MSEFVRGAIEPGHMPVVMMTPEQYTSLIRPHKITPYTAYFLAYRLGQTISDVVKLAAQDTLIKKTKGEIPSLLRYPETLSVAATTMTGPELERAVTDAISSQYQFLMDAWSIGNLSGMGSSFMSSVEQFMNPGQLLYSYSTLQYQTSVIPRMKRHWNMQYRPAVPNALMAWQLLLRNQIRDTEFRQYAAWDGWSDKDIDLLKELWKAFPNIRSSFRMHMRGAIPYKEYQAHVHMSGWPKGWDSKIYKMYEWLPNAREAYRLFRRGKIKKAIMNSLFKGQGFDSRWYKNLEDLWERIPLPRDAFNMHMRGKIGYKTFASYISKNEWEPGADEYLYAIFQKLPSAREAFFMQRKDLITVSERDALYKANGYDEKYHSDLTDNYQYVPTLYDLTRIADYVELDLIWATKILVERGMRTRDISKVIAMLKIRPLRNEITRQIYIWLTRRQYGWVSETDFAAAIQVYVDNGLVQTTEKTLLLEEGQLKYEDELMREQIEILEWRFRTALISQEELEEGLLALGIVQEKVNLMVELLLAQGYYGYY